MLRVTNLQAAYGASQVLFGIDLSIAPGEMVTLLGRNGMGKTTTVRSIMGLETPSEGNIRFEGREIRGQAPFKVARAGIGLVPEGRQIFPNLTVWENLHATAANPTHRENPWTIDRVLKMFPGLSARIHNMGNRLSGGEQQMLAVGRALLTNPKLLILDEATEGLAPLVRDEIWHCLENLKDQGQAILLIDKNVDALTRIGDRHYIIERGKVVWSGSSDAIKADEEMQRRHLGV